MCVCVYTHAYIIRDQPDHGLSGRNMLLNKYLNNVLVVFDWSLLMLLSRVQRVCVVLKLKDVLVISGIEIISTHPQSSRL